MTLAARYLVACYVATVLAVAGASSARGDGTDMNLITCRAFLGSGIANESTMIMWLLGYHSGTRHRVIAMSKDYTGGYGTKLGRYCGTHPDDNVVDASEKILADDLDQGVH